MEISGAAKRGTGEDPDRVAAARYANGEIGRDEYDDIRRQLDRAETTA